MFFLQLLSHTNFATMLAGLVEARKGSPSVHRLELGDRHQTYSIYRVIFLTGPPLKMSLDWPPPNLLGLAPPKWCNHIHFARHLDFFDQGGGPVWDSNVFLKSVTYRPTLSKFRGVPVKKITLYNRWLLFKMVFLGSAPLEHCREQLHPSQRAWQRWTWYARGHARSSLDWGYIKHISMMSNFTST